jgi:uncharacterized membrane protein
MADYGVANMWFCVSILLIMAMLLLIYARWRWLPTLLHWIMSGQKQRGAENESLHKSKEDDISYVFELQNNALEKMQGGKFRRFIAIVISHIGVYSFLLLLYWRYIAPNPYCSPEGYFPPRVRHIILLCMVVIVFPLFSIVWEIERRKAKRKKHYDNSTHKRELNR